MIGQDTHRLVLEGALPLNKIYVGQRTYFEAPRQTSALAFALNTSVDLAVEYSARSSLNNKHPPLYTQLCLTD